MDLIAVLSIFVLGVVVGVLVLFYRRWGVFARGIEQRFTVLERHLRTLEHFSDVEARVEHLQRQQQQVQHCLDQQQVQWQQTLEQQRQAIEQVVQRSNDRILERLAQQFSALMRKVESWNEESAARHRQQLTKVEPQQEELRQLHTVLQDMQQQLAWQVQHLQQLQEGVVQWQEIFQQQVAEHTQQQTQNFQRLLQYHGQGLQRFLGTIERNTNKLLLYHREFGKLSKAYQEWTRSVGKHIQSTLQHLRRIHHAIERLSREAMQPKASVEEVEEQKPKVVDVQVTQSTLEAEISSLLRELRLLHEQLQQKAPQFDSQYLPEVQEILAEIERSAEMLLQRLQGVSGRSAETIFVLEDSQMFREHLEYILERRGYQLLFASTIAEARKVLEDHMPDLLLLDIELPDGNGLQFCREIRQRKAFADVPILFISSLTDKETKLQGFQAGADDYVPKPFDELELLARIERQLELSRSRRVLSEGLFSMVRVLEGTLHLQYIFLKLLQQLAEARYAAEQANRAKSTFLASMSHELRTPLNAILGFAQILRQDANLSPKQREYVETMYRSGNHLLQMINDILDLSKIEAGKIELLPVDIELAQFVEDLRGMFHLRCQEKGLWLKFEVDSQLPRYIVADAQKLRQVLINLIGNAIKFTSEGGITVRVRRVVDSSGNPRLRWEVEDTGRGIPKEQIDKIMEPFHQVEAMVSEGTGLGLTISKALVALMGGQLQVRSRVGEGSVFFFDLPLKTPVADLPPTPSQQGAAPASAPRLVAASPAVALIVDDSRTNRKILHEFLAQMNFTCVEAADGWKAWKLLQDPQQPFDVVLTDIVMPEMNGIELVKRIRAQEQQTQQHLPVIGITASVLQLSDEELLDVGFDAVLHKPFQFQDLVALLQQKTRIQFREVTEEPIEKPAVTPEDIQRWFEQLSAEQRAKLLDAMLVQDLPAIVDALSELPAEDPVVQFFRQKLEESDVVYFAKLAMQFG